MKQFSLVALVIVFVFSVVHVASAATYQYVNSFGNLNTVTANSFDDAFTSATDRDVHSGMMVVSGSNSNTVGVNYSYNGPIQYGYVNADGFLVVVSADSSVDAFGEAANKSMYSGVILIDSSSDMALVGDRVMVVDSQ